jgi:SAM-dependent methyltransferase
MDYSYAMCDRAREILIAGEPIQVRAVRDRGFPEFVLAAAKRLENVVIAQGSALDLPFRKHAFDCVLATSLLDRAGDPVRAISEIASALRPGGVLILSTPMNFERAGLWSQLACHEDLYRSVRNAGIEIDTSFTELLNRERRDAAGNIEEWNMVVVRGKLTC